MGPFELMDLVGIDVNFEVAKSFWEQSFHEPRWQPSPIQERMVASGRLGAEDPAWVLRLLGGAHRPEDRRAARLRLARPTPGRDARARILGRIVAQIVNEAHFAIAEGVGTATDVDKAMRLGFNGRAGRSNGRGGRSRAGRSGASDSLWEDRREVATASPPTYAPARASADSRSARAQRLGSADTTGSARGLRRLTSRRRRATEPATISARPDDRRDRDRLVEERRAVDDREAGAI